MKVEFYYDEKPFKNEDLKYAVIFSKFNNKWVYVKHKNRDTWEIPGGHREKDENIFDCAKRELFEETGASDFHLVPLFIYSVEKEGIKDYGKIFFAEINVIGNLPETEIEKIGLFDTLPDNLTYPQIIPFLEKEVQKNLSIKD